MSVATGIETPESRFRTLPLFWRWVIVVFSIGGIAIALYQTFQLRLAGMVIMDTSYYYLMLAFFLSIAFIVYPFRKGATSKLSFYFDIFLFLVTAGVSFFLARQGLNIRLQGWGMIAPPHIMALALLVWALLLEASRRAGGVVITIVVLIFSLYPVVAGYMPGIFEGIQFPIGRVALYHILSSESAIGIPLRTFAELIIGFIIFGAALQLTGGGRFFINLALAFLGNRRGGPAKVSVISSALFGTMSGSVISNVLSTGCFTIPAMKKAGYAPYYAGAVEACSSTGGVLMPPVMGATAFVMASFLGVPYLTVVIAAVIPSILYYLGLFIQVDGYAAQHGLKGWDPQEIQPLLKTIKSGWLYIISFAVLLFFLFLRREAQAPFLASATMLLLAMFQRETRLTPAKLFNFIEDSGKMLSELVAIVAVVGMILGALSLTGLAQSLSGQLTQLAGGSIPLLLILGFITSFIMGMGMTITACYVFLAITLAPALVEAGLNPLAVHLFVMYCGMISFITPPVALGAFAGATLAGASAMKTAWTATRLGVVIYIVPFLFAINPALILGAGALENLKAVIFAVPGVILMASALQGYLIGVGDLSASGGISKVYAVFARLTLLVAGILMAYPETITDWIGLGLAIAVILFLTLRRVNSRKLLSRI